MRNHLLTVLCTAAILGGLVVSSHAQPKPTSSSSSSKAKGSSFEYTTLVREKYWDTDTMLLGRWTPWKTIIDTTDVTNPQLSLNDYLNKLGSDGWELVSAAPLHGDGDRVMYYIFKRPKP